MGGIGKSLAEQAGSLKCCKQGLMGNSDKVSKDQNVQ
jgi:hypothetical protein